ncbi:hypothetical protein KTR66_00495 [Roseococcus sp. SDR]|uniref:hypothetical protein n=1 Tax=Roseococcus sp. SDR TaxID=2835532 RepID=UPI001BCBF163|nr:hypothetical protein [Roseococcus sp. SDR]MBS7788447.1 hypothetical protein [Roseococcus sp. SDR]MBV1843761.1 hypothetical protein [Roseococcus sp. SDR]
MTRPPWLQARLLRDGWTLPALALSAVALAGALLIIAHLLRGLWLSHTAMPFMDQLDYASVEDISGILLGRHNEHLILLPKLGFMLDLVLGGSNAINFGTILAIQLAHGLLLGWLLTAGNVEWRRPDVVALGVALAITFSALQYENLSWGFQTQFVGVYALATACFAVVFLGGTGWLATLGACLLGAAAVLTMANGVLVLPIAAVIALLAGRPWRQVLAYAAAGLLLLAGFMAGHVSPEAHSSPLDALRMPGSIAAYVAIFFGRPIVEILRLPVSADGTGWLACVLIGGAGLALAAAFGLRALLRRRMLRPVEWVLLAGIAYIVASALVTAAGRHSFGWIQATSPRYGTPALLLWCMLLLWLHLLAHRGGRLQAVGASTIVVLAVLALLQQQPRSVAVLEHFVASRYPAETALIAGVRDEAAFREVFPIPEVVESRVADLRAHRRGIFAAPHAEWMGRPLQGTLRVLPEGRCLGSLDGARLLGPPPGQIAAATGWAWDRQERTRINRLLLVNEAGVIVGYARGPLRRADVPAGTGRAVPDTRVGWVGRAAAGPGTVLRAYGILGADAACALGSAVTVTE